MQLELFRVLVRRHFRKPRRAVDDSNPVEGLPWHGNANSDDWIRREQ